MSHRFSRGCRDPENYCPICGKPLREGRHDGHHCPSRTLQGIDSANTRALRDDGDHEARNYSKRLAEGFTSLEVD